MHNNLLTDTHAKVCMYVFVNIYKNKVLRKVQNLLQNIKILILIVRKINTLPLPLKGCYWGSWNARLRMTSMFPPLSRHASRTHTSLWLLSWAAMLIRSADRHRETVQKEHQGSFIYPLYTRAKGGFTSCLKSNPHQYQSPPKIFSSQKQSSYWSITQYTKLQFNKGPQPSLFK